MKAANKIMGESNDAKRAFSRAIGPQVTSPPTDVPAPEEEPAEHLSKYSVLLDNDEATTLDSITLQVRRQLGRPIKKSEVLRGLIALTADDPTIRNQLVEELRSRQVNGQAS